MIISLLEENKRKRKRKKVMLLFFVCLIFLLLGGAGSVFMRTIAFTHKVFKSNGIRGDIASFLPVSANSASYSSDIDKSFKTNTPVNILLMGYGGGQHDGGYLTDSMMVIHVDPAQKNVAMLSIPRDLWVAIPTGATSLYSKINAAYAIGMDKVNYQNRDVQFKGEYGGGNLAKKVVGDVLGTQIDYFVSVNFDGFIKIIDALGGIDINVENSFNDFYYPSGDDTASGPVCNAPMNTKTFCRYWHVSFAAGKQNMTSQLALEYTRSRHAEGVEGTDFARGKRQQNVLQAIKHKATQIGALSHAFSIMDSLQNNIQTDLTLADSKDLIGVVKEWGIENPIHASLETANLIKTGTASDGEDIVEPTAGIGQYTQIQSFFANIWTRVSLLSELQTANVILIDGSKALVNLVQVEKDLHESAIPFTLNLAQTKDINQTSTVFDTSNGRYPVLLKQLQEKLGNFVFSSAPLGNQPADGRIIILLGSDFQKNTQISPSP